MSRILILKTMSPLNKKQSILEQEYIAASKDEARLKDLEELNALNLESWDEYDDINKPII